MIFPDCLDSDIFNSKEDTHKGNWMNSPAFTEQVVFDLRSDDQKLLQNGNQTEKTFKSSFNIWEENAVIIASEEVVSEKQPNSVIHHLAYAEQMVHIISANSP